MENKKEPAMSGDGTMRLAGRLAAAPVLHDLAIIGGGVNGCGIARDAAGRGMSVYLCEQGDLAQGTSSASTKLIHGGLRYLEYYEFRLVREALIEREVLWGMAPHIISPLRFVLPHHKALRPAWLLRIGLFLYDHLGGRKRLPGTRVLDLRSDPAGRPLKPGLRKAFEYSDCWVDDARLVVLNAMDAAARGAVVETRTRCVSARREDGVWRVEVEEAGTGARRTVRARALVNASGPWVGQMLGDRIESHSADRVRLVRGSHIVVRRLFEHDRAYIFQHGDGRIVFAIPYEGDFTLIGTTDVDFQGDPAAAAITDEEVDYLCGAASEYFIRPVRKKDIVWTYSGVRPLYDDGVKPAQEATRDYVLKVEAAGGEAPVLNVFGGKITTYRRLAEAAVAKLRPFFPDVGGGWTAGAALPGGDFGIDEFEARVDALGADYAFLDRAWARRLVGAYGTCAWTMLNDAGSAADLGESFGGSLSEREIRYLMKAEWARTSEDVLWRRSKLGLRLTEDEAANLGQWMRSQRADAVSAA